MNRGLSFAKDRPRTPAENSYRSGLRSQAHWAVSGVTCAGQSESGFGLRGMLRFLSFSHEKLRNRNTRRNKEHEDTFLLLPKTADHRLISRPILRTTIAHAGSYFRSVKDFFMWGRLSSLPIRENLRELL